MSRDRRPDYAPAFDRAEDGVRRWFARHLEELDAAAALAMDLLDAPEPVRRELLRQPQFHALGLCELLLERSREAWTEEPARAVELAALAVHVAARLDVVHYGAELTEDARARAWAHLGNACRIGSDLRRAEEALTTAWEHHRQAGEDAFTEAEILSFEGSLRNSQGRFDDAVRLFDRALAIYREGRDRQREGRMLINKGLALGYGGRLKEAIRLTRRGLAAIDPAEEPRLEVAARHNLILYLHEGGDSREALTVLEQSRRLYDVLGEPLHRVRLRWVEGKIFRDLGRLGRGRDSSEGSAVRLPGTGHRFRCRPGLARPGHGARSSGGRRRGAALGVRDAPHLRVQGHPLRGPRRPGAPAPGCRERGDHSGDPGAACLAAPAGSDFSWSRLKTLGGNT